MKVKVTVKHTAYDDFTSRGVWAAELVAKRMRAFSKLDPNASFEFRDLNKVVYTWTTEEEIDFEG
jgi:hypothetical protein